MKRVRTASASLLSGALLAASLVSAGPSAAAPAASSGWAVTSRYAVGGDGGWDYLTVDAAARRIYVSRGTHVAVVDADSGKVVGDIPGTEGVHGIALAPEMKKGFTSNGRAGTVTVFDLPSLAVAATWKVTGENPDAILYEPVSKRLLTFNGRGKNVTVFDAATGSVAGTIPVGGKPEFAVSDPAGRVYVNVEDTAEILAIDPAAASVKARWSIAPCQEPTGLAIDAKAGVLFAGCGNKLLAVVRTSDGKLLGTPPIGGGCDGVAFDPGTGLAFAANGEGTVTVVKETSPGTWAPVQTVPTQQSARTIALDAAKGRLYLPAAKFGPPPSPAPAGAPRARPAAVAGSFELLVVGPR
jgi:DNA-binding beta-propeller fold protein YncE